VLRDITKMIPLRIPKHIREYNIKINAIKLGRGLNGFRLDHDRGQ